MKTSALYARVSTSGQEKEQTINSQIAEIVSKAQGDGSAIDQSLQYVDDGWSGELLARPALDNLRDAVKNKTFDTLYLYDLGRLSRNFLNQLILKKELTEAGIQIISLHDINGENPESLLAQNVMGLFHDYERIKIAERFRRGKLYKAKSGILFGWQAPYGYQYVKGEEKGTGYFKVVPHEVEIVKKIFQLVGVEGLTIRQVIKRLYEQKLHPKKSKNKYWSTSTLSRRLRDETYIGITHYNKSQSIVPENPTKNEKYKKIKKSSRHNNPKDQWFAIEVEPIIEKELFTAVQKQLILNDSFAMRNKKNNYLLSGLAYCTCGRKRAGEGNSKTHNFYYRCTDRVLRYPLPKECHNKGVNASVLDDRVWSTIVKLLSNKNLIKKHFGIWKEKQKQPTSNTDFLKTELDKQLDVFETQEKRYLEAYGEGAISLSQYKEQVQAIQNKKTTILTKLQRVSTDSSTPSAPVILPDLDVYCEKMKIVLTNRDFEKKLPIVRKVIQKVTTDGTIATIQGHIPLQIPVENTQENVKFKSEYRYSRSSKRWQVYPFQRPSQKNRGRCRKLSLLYDRTQCWRRRSTRRTTSRACKSCEYSKNCPSSC